MAALTAALITGAAAIGGAAIQSSAAGKAADAAKAAAKKNNALQTQIYNDSKGNFAPYIKTGTNANDAIADFLGLNGSSGQNQAFETYAKSTGADYTQRRGVDAITSTAATRGLLNSGATLKAATAFGQQNAQQYVGSYLDRLFGLSGQGLSAASSLAGVGQNYAGAVSQNNNNAADATGNAALAQGSIFSNLLTQLAGTAGYTRGQSSYGQNTGHGGSSVLGGL